MTSTGSHAASPLRIEVEAHGELSLALVENAIPLVTRLSLTNSGDDQLDALVVEVALRPDFSATWTTHIAAIPPGGTFHVEDVGLALDRDKLVNQLERGAAELAITVKASGVERPLAASTQRIDVLAYNEWVRRGPPPLLAAFVLPNHPEVAALLREARAPLEALTGQPALDGYQSHDPARVAAIAEAVYRAIQARGITYSNPPASFEDTGQKIRTPEQIATDQVATCLDVSVLVAAALEQAGLHPLIVLIQGHAFPGVWLDDHYSADGYLDDAAMLRKLIDLGRVLVFDSSATVTRPPVPFAEARRVAQRALETTPLHEAIDVKGARTLHFTPMPLRVQGGYAAVVEVPAAAPQSGPAGVPRPTASDGARSRPSARTKHPRIEAWKQRLLDTSLRNRLLNFRDTKQTVDLLCAESGVVEDAIASGAELRLRGRPDLLGDKDLRSKKLLDARIADDAVKASLGERLARGELYADHSAELTDQKLLTLFRAAREALAETGTNTLCLTIGMLHWFESDTSEQPRRAPIVLVPVMLQRSARTAGFTLRGTGEDARLNVTLFEKLRLDTGITVPELDEIPLDDAGVDVPRILQAVRTAVLNLKRWEVKDELHLGLFSFAKFQMWADLEQHLDALLDNPVVQHLLDGKGEPFPNDGAFPDPAELDDRLAPQDLVCPLDADASQLAAVAAAADGKTFVLQGPPGTGKSQTITNLITHCMAHGKRVLFVAEKAAALEVVQRRLAQVGLGPYVLELHSHKAGKLAVIEQFREALEAAPVGEPASWERDTARLAEERRSLNAYVRALHRPGDAGFSIFQALARLDVLHDAPSFALPAACADSAERFAELGQQVAALTEALRTLAPIADSPWQGCQLPGGWQVDLPSRVTEAVDQAIARLDAARRAGGELAAQLGAGALDQIGDVDALCEVAAVILDAPPHGDALARGDWAQVEGEARELALVVRRRSEALAHLDRHYRDGLFALDLDALAARFQKFARAFVLFAWWGLRGARKLVRTVARDGRLRGRQEVAADLVQAREARALEAEVASRAERGRALYGAAWQGETTEPGALDRAVSWAERWRRTLAAVRPGLLDRAPDPVDRGGQLAGVATRAREAAAALRTSLDALARLLGWTWPAVTAGEWEAVRARLERWRADVPRLRAWHVCQASAARLTEAGCDELARAAIDGAITPDQLAPCFERGVTQAWVRRALAQDPVLAAFDGERHHHRVAAFAELDRDLLGTARTVARARVVARAPQAAQTATGGEMGVLQKELQKKRGHLAIRKLLAAIPQLASRLKPCFLMSPMSVATYLDPHAPAFDVVVFDEASQIPSHDAIGVLARGRSAVVVGDSKQLPPTTFFQAGGDDDPPDDNAFEELESILNECLAAGLPERRLDWHYRSRHETLIAFSNYFYYRNRLNTFPSVAAHGAGRGVSLREVDGFYDKGGRRTNQAEAEAVVAELVARLRAPGAGEKSYGVVTFSQAQQQLVEDLLERACAEHPEIEGFFRCDDRAEPVIVKNLENIQGDERDVMIFSICYGPDQNGKVSMNFGPLNRDGGERRLNVAVTRAREELVVFATLRPEQIDLGKTKALGVRHLKTFLDYARRGPSAIAEAVAVAAKDQFDSPFEEQVCERVRALGYTVHTQVGCAGYRVDLGVCDPDAPGRYLLGIECDGAHYHSARSARERDRLRGQVLAGLGWRIHRIWSTDWWQHAAREVEKVKAAIEAAKAAAAAVAAAPAAAATRATLADEVTSGAAAAAASVDGATGATIVDSAATGGSVAPATSPRAPGAPARPYVITPGSPSRAGDGGAPPLTRGVAEMMGLVPYRVAEVAEGRRSPDDFYDPRHERELAQVVLAVVEVEAPLTLRVLGRRIAPYFGLQRTTARVEERLRGVLGAAARIEDDVVWRADQDASGYKAFRVAPADARRDPGDIPLIEVANASESVLRGSIAVEHDELVKLAARALGFARVGGKVAEHVTQGIALLVARGVARRDGDKVVLLG